MIVGIVVNYQSVVSTSGVLRFFPYFTLNPVFFSLEWPDKHGKHVFNPSNRRRKEKDGFQNSKVTGVSEPPHLAESVPWFVRKSPLLVKQLPQLVRSTALFFSRSLVSQGRCPF